MREERFGQRGRKRAHPRSWCSNAPVAHKENLDGEKFPWKIKYSSPRLLSGSLRDAHESLHPESENELIFCMRARSAPGAADVCRRVCVRYHYCWCVFWLRVGSKRSSSDYLCSRNKKCRRVRRERGFRRAAMSAIPGAAAWEAIDNALVCNET